jgi:diguanylate cyclase (GGDEF)-like protein
MIELSDTLNLCVLSLTPFLVLLLDLVLVAFFALMAFRAESSTRWRLASLALVFLLSFAIDLIRILEFRSPWFTLANSLWNCFYLFCLAYLTGTRRAFGIALLVVTTLATTAMFLAGVPYDFISSITNAILALGGMVLMGRLYLRTRGFGSGTLTALWFLFLIHGASYHLAAGAGELALSYGFFIAVLILWCQTVFGYIHLPREIEGKVPVRLPLAYPIATMALGGVLDLGFNTLASRLAVDHKTVWIALLALGVVGGILLPLLAAYARHRLRLVANADEIEQRLEERTAETVRQQHLLEEQNLLLQSKAEELARLAATDSLTSLANRRAGWQTLKDECERSTRYSSPLACAMFDVDHFKAINDRFGHDVGDEVLKAVARAIRDGIRTTDTLCRFGGEEFLLICPGIDDDGAEKLAERLRTTVAGLTLRDELDVTISGGVAAFRPGDDINSVIKRADSALYEAKRFGRDCIVVARPNDGPLT